MEKLAQIRTVAAPVENDDYIVTLDLVSQETNTWRMIIAYNDFFERNNL